jgi:hypothetical protein
LSSENWAIQFDAEIGKREKVTATSHTLLYRVAER